MDNIELRYKSKDQCFNQLHRLLEQKWTCLSENSGYFVFVKSTATLRTHLIIAILAGWWLLFIPNLLYQLMGFRKIKVLKLNQLSSLTKKTINLNSSPNGLVDFKSDQFSLPG